MSTFNFGRPYKVKLLALCVRDIVFLNGYRDLIKPQWFLDETLVDVARLILEYHDEFQIPPTLDALDQAVADFIEANPNRKEKQSDYDAALTEIRTTTLLETEDVINRASEFARREALRIAIEESINDLAKGDHSAMESRFRDALQVGVNKTDIGISYFEDEGRFDRGREKNTISTGLVGLDDLLGGGIATEELCVIEAPTNGFKSGALVNLCTAALWQDCDVVYLSLEIKEPQIGRRFDGALCGMVTSRDGKENVLKEIQKKKEEIGGNLWLKSWTLGDADIHTIRAYLHLLASKGHICRPGRKLVLALDYPAILKPLRHYSEKRHEVRENYQGALRLSEEFKAAVYAPMQTNRAAEKKKLITKADLAECYAVASDAQIILSLNQTQDEKDQSQMRVFVAKSRESAAFKYIDVLLDMERTAWREPVSALYREKAEGTKYSETKTGGPVSAKGIKILNKDGA